MALAADALVISLAVDAPALAALFLLFLFIPGAALLPAGEAAFALFLALFLCRDATGGFSRKWFGHQIEDREGNPPGLLRSIVRNLPLLIPGWNLYEAIRVLQDGTRPRSLDIRLGLRLREIS